jgi:hypothetical protein
MPEAVLETPPATESLGWRAGLPGDLQKNEDFAKFKTVGDFAKHHLEVAAKVPELEKKLGDYVPKLPDNATDEDKNLYYEALGRPKQPSEYEFDGEDKNAPEWTNFWKQQFHALGLTKAQTKQLSTVWNAQQQKMVDAHNASVKAEMTTAEQKLRTEMGDKFDTNVELAKRMTVKHLGSEFDKTFVNLPSEARFGVVKLLLKVAELTGEDRSPQSGNSQKGNAQSSFISYDKSPAPPKKG